MRCPYCGNDDTQVKDSRPTDDNSAIRRRRQCQACGGCFSCTRSKVVKRSGRRVPFDRDKLARSVEIATRKRDVPPEAIERLINGIVRQLESSGETDIGSEQIGTLLMQGLKELDPVAYVRFASVYRNFSEAADFGDVLKELGQTPAPPKAT
jgi:transcriptional repressor NrdR